VDSPEGRPVKRSREDLPSLGNEDQWLGFLVGKTEGEVLATGLGRASEGTVMPVEALVALVAGSGGLEEQRGPGAGAVGGLPE
jgi:hypothetical protein